MSFFAVEDKAKFGKVHPMGAGMAIIPAQYDYFDKIFAPIFGL
jgi:hypothetical protein